MRSASASIDIGRARCPAHESPGARCVTCASGRAHVPVATERRSETPTLSRLRALVGLTAADLARVLMVSRSTVSHWEAGTHRPAPAYRHRLAGALNVSQVVIEQAMQHLPASRSEGLRLPGLGRLRRSRGVSARDVATALGISASTLSTWERGAVPVPAHRLPRVAAVLGMTPAALVQCGSVTTSAPEMATAWAAGRRSQRMSQREAAAILGVSVSHLSRIENGHRRPATSLAAAMVRTYRIVETSAMR
jgi:transcriptional regulator with XRE-family HTH domain